MVLWLPSLYSSSVLKLCKVNKWSFSVPLSVGTKLSAQHCCFAAPAVEEKKTCIGILGFCENLMTSTTPEIDFVKFESSFFARLCFSMIIVIKRSWNQIPPCAGYFSSLSFSFSISTSCVSLVHYAWFSIKICTLGKIKLRVTKVSRNLLSLRRECCARAKYFPGLRSGLKSILNVKMTSMTGLFSSIAVSKNESFKTTL